MPKSSFRLASVAIAVLAASATATGQQAIAPAAGSTAAVSPPQGTAPVALRYTFAAGQHMHYTTRTVQSAPAPIGDTVTTGGLDIETLQVRADGGARRRLRLSGLQMSGAAIPAEMRTHVAECYRATCLTVSDHCFDTTA